MLIWLLHCCFVIATPLFVVARRVGVLLPLDRGGPMLVADVLLLLLFSALGRVSALLSISKYDRARESEKESGRAHTTPKSAASKSVSQ